MSPEERALHYAKLFTALGERWRTCVPCDDTPDRTRDRMHLDGVRIERLEGATRWELTNR